MRNLKKFLALVLAMVMAFSLMLSASATDISKFEDQDKVTDEFVESVAVLTGLDVIKGDGDEDNPSIRPQDEITRAEAAALVYRIVTGDINDAQVQLYSDYGKFSDVKSDDWFAGYVGYCQNAGIIKGTSPTTFSPYGKVTGYEVLAMILRAAGYGKNNEFTGSQWQVNVASLAKTKHISDSVTSTLYNYTLNMNARREIVAELLFRGSLIPQVTWSSALGYSEYDQPLNGNRNASLASEVFNLQVTPWTYGTWGIPQFTWTATLNPSKSRTVATLTADPSFEFHEGDKRECDVAEMLEITDQDTYVLWVNASRVTNTYRIKATDTVTRVGGWGRKVAIYLEEDMNKQYPWHNIGDYWTNADGGSVTVPDTFVMIDTYLAKVISTTDAVLDPAGHVITPARMVVDLYDRDQNQVLRRTISKATGSKENWEYSAGQTISLEGRANSLNTTIPAGQTDPEAWAFSLPTVLGNTQTLVQGTDVRAITLREGVQAKQTSVYWNNGKHQVGGEDKTDDLALRMDKAGNNIDTTFTWIYDDYGYLLGIDDGGKVNYGVITSVYVAYGANETTDGLAKAIATVKYADGTTGTETIDYFLVSGTAQGDKVSGGQRPTDIDYTMNPITKDTDALGTPLNLNGVAAVADANVVQLWPAYNIGGDLPMTEYNSTMPFSTGAPAPRRGVSQGTVYMAPVALSNTQAYAEASNARNNHGILNNNLFKFVKSAGDKTVAIEVAGGQNANSSNLVPGETGFSADRDIDTTVYTKASGNQGDFAGHWAAVNDSGADGTGGKVYKTLSYITNDPNNVVAWIDDNTQIMVRNENGSISCYNGVSALPGDITISTTVDSATNNKHFNEIDWADTDNDGRAEVVYLTGTIEGVTAYGLFYSNALVASWNGTSAQIDGFLNGEETTLTFNSYEEFNKINSQTGYRGHLFAVKQIGGVVTNVMQTVRSANKTEVLLPNSGDTLVQFGVDANASESSTVATGVSVNGTVTGSSPFVGDFKYGDGTDTGFAGTNPYTANTVAVYWQDNSATPVVYNNSADWSLYGATVTVGGTTTYRLTPNSKVYGLGNGVVLAEGATALEYLNHSYTNDVTIVYENNDGNDSFSVLEMYIQTDPNITPNNPNTSTGVAMVPYLNSSNLPGNVAAGGAQTAKGNSARDSYMKSLDNGVYGSNLDMSYNQDVVDIAKTIYLKFTTTGGGSCTLNIRNSADASVYTETTSFTGAGGHYFYIDIGTRANNPAATDPAWTTGALPAGVYTYSISGAATGYSGSFTVR